MNAGRRAADKKGWRAVTCWIAQRLSEVWDWFDKRNIDLHLVLGVALWLTVRTVEWALGFAEDHWEKDAVKMGAVLGAVLVPLSGLQAALFKFYVDALSTRRRIELERCKQ